MIDVSRYKKISQQAGIALNCIKLFHRAALLPALWMMRCDWNELTLAYTDVVDVAWLLIEFVTTIAEHMLQCLKLVQHWWMGR